MNGARRVTIRRAIASNHPSIVMALFEDDYHRNLAHHLRRGQVARLIDRNGFERAVFTECGAPYFETRVMRRPDPFGPSADTTLQVHVARFELCRRDRRGNPVYYER